MASADKIAEMALVESLKNHGMNEEQIKSILDAKGKQDKIKALDGTVGRLINRMREEPASTGAATNLCIAWNEYATACGSGLRLAWTIDGTPPAPTTAKPSKAK